MPEEHTSERHFIDGNEAVALSAVRMGCRFFAGYPITPATTIYQTMLRMLPPLGGVCMQGEDEIASIGMCIGASMTGAMAMTATSGPGISLFSEHISFAIGSEIPLVIVDVQRLGPSTGSATRGADGDVQFLRWGNSGGLPVIVLAPETVADCYLLTAHAFNLAERFRIPVFLASNKEIGMTRESLDLRDIQLPALRRRTVSAPDAAATPFAVPPGMQVPDFIPIGGKALCRQTSSTHGPDGYITVDPEIITASQQRLMEKINSRIDEFAFTEHIRQQAADTLIISYGVSARAAREAIRGLEGTGRSADLLVLKTLWPVPATQIREAVSGKTRVVVVEMNMGQYVREIERVTKHTRVECVGRMDGRLITPQEIEERILNGQLD